jgi:hypothetical protein
LQLINLHNSDSAYENYGELVLDEDCVLAEENQDEVYATIKGNNSTDLSDEQVTAEFNRKR